jgi:hypothetical protein
LRELNRKFFSYVKLHGLFVELSSSLNRATI